METFKYDELELQKQLQQLCDKSGRELDVQKSAFVFEKLGLLYQTKSPDKISLIRSAALFNAAIVRQSSNPSFQHNLHELCKHVLSSASALQKDANLLEISDHAKQLIRKMRKNVVLDQAKIKLVQENLEHLEEFAVERKYVKIMKLLQRKLSTDYKHVMSYISRQCIDIMGTPPCKYALAGMGSLARDEITPFSDFEHVLILENPSEETNESHFDLKEYFRWYSVIFHIIVVNLQETDLYSVCIPCLNNHSNREENWFYDNFTPQGISFDGMMPHACHFPLGKTEKTNKLPWTAELIQTVDQMVSYLEVKNLKEGYKLGDLLTRTCFIEGDEKIYQKFFDKVQLRLNKEGSEQRSNVIQQLEEDLRAFDIAQNLMMFSFDKAINIKRIIYRSITLFISALERLSNLAINSGFDIIEEFRSHSMINNFAAHRLSHAVAVACHVRLSYYMAKDRQDDDIFKEEESWGQKKLDELTKIVSPGGLANMLATSFVLQEMLKQDLSIHKFNDLLEQRKFSSKMIMLNFVGLYDETIRVGENYLKDHGVTRADVASVLDHLGDAYIRTKQFTRYLEFLKDHKQQFSEDPELNRPYSKIKYNELSCLYALGEYNAVNDEVEAALKSDLRQDERLNFLFLNALVKCWLLMYHEALSSFRDLLKPTKQSKLLSKDIQTALIMQLASVCLISSKRKHQGLHLAREGLNFVEMIGATNFHRKWFTKIINKHQYSQSNAN